METSALSPYSRLASYPSTNNESRKQFNDCDLPAMEIAIYIFSFLPIKDLIHVGATCHTWKLYSEDRSIWTIFCNRINHHPKASEHLKLVVIEKIKSLITYTKENNSERALQAHITLSKFGLTSLEKAFIYAKTITITEEEKQAHPSSSFYASSFYDKCFSLAYAYLEDKDFTKAEEIMNNMVPSTQRGIIAFEIVKIYLKISNLEKALCAMRYIKQDQLESLPSLSLFIWKAKQPHNIDIALRALKEFSNFAICLSCAKDFNEFLIESGEFEKSKCLQISFLKIIEEKPTSNDVMYYTYNGQIEKAIQRALLFSETYQRIQALDKILHVIKNATYLNAGINGELKERQLNEVKSLRENLWKDFTKLED